MIYELASGGRDTNECTVKAFEDDWELAGLYKGHYDRKAHAWCLWIERRYSGHDLLWKLILGEDEVRPKSKPMPLHADRAPARKTKTKAEPKERPWWTLPDPEGQIKLG